LKHHILKKDISSKILILGPDYHNHRGGIGAVIGIYSKYFEIFNFIPTHKSNNVLYKSYIFFISLFKIFFTLLKNRNIKIVHIHGSSYGSFYRKFICFIISKYIFRKKVIYHIHSGEYYIFYSKSNALIKKLIQKFINNADCLICLSKSWEQFFIDNFNPEKIKILPNIIDYPVTIYKNKDTGKISFLFLGLIDKKKGIFDVIEVIKNNINLFDNKIELVVGGNGEVVKLQNIIKENKIENIVKFVGWVQNETKAQYLQNSDIFILPSYNEGLPISILEAMSYGKPIISTNVGAISEIVQNYENGFLISPGNLVQIEKTMTYFIENPQYIEKLGNVSQQMVKKYLPDSVILKIENIFNELTEKLK
jgi:glycosyltransferase involved in cell wall biosynthesis